MAGHIRLLVLSLVLGVLLVPVPSTAETDATCGASGDQCAANWYNAAGGAGTVCMTMGSSHYETHNPDKWNALTANNCNQSHQVRVQVFLYDSNDNVLDWCDTGHLSQRAAQCQAEAESPASALRNHQMDIGVYNKTFYSWSSSD